MTTTPYAPPSGTVAVDTAALARLEPFLTETVEQFDLAIRYARRLTEPVETRPAPDGSSMRAVPGVIERLSVTHATGFLDCATQLFATHQGIVRQVFDGLVEMRRRYERTEDDNTTEVDERLRATGASSRAPRDDTTLPRDPLLGTAAVPRYDELSAVLTDPTSVTLALVYPNVDVGRPGSVRGKAMEALGPSIAHVSQRIDEWAQGSSTGAATSATCFEQLAKAAHSLRARVESAFDYVRVYWVATTSDAAANRFASVLVGLEDLEVQLATMAGYERTTAQQVDATLTPTPELVGTIKDRYQAFLEMDDAMMSISANVRVPSKMSFLAWLLQLSVVTTSHLAYNKAYQEFCAAMENGYRSVHATREKYTTYVRTLPACPAIVDAYPPMPSRY